MTSSTMKQARRIWDYLASFNDPAPSDAIVVCCSYDLRVCDHACRLLRESLAPRILFSGKSGNWTEHLWDRTEAAVFRDRAIAQGIDPDCILIENEATNIGENLAFSKRLLPEVKTVTFVTKPNTILRVKLTAPLQWPGITTHVACPLLQFPEEISNVVGILGVIHEMVGDLQRIEAYPMRGYQVEHALPTEILESRDYLVAHGFTRHLMS